MNRIAVALIVAGSLAIGQIIYFVPTPAPVLAPVVSVQSYGATGNGVTDDTAAIQAAFNVAAASIYKPSVYFPAGTYILSGPVSINSNVSGDGAFLWQRGQANIFDAPNLWRWRCSGLTFYGGKTQLNLGNANLDQSSYVVEKCFFKQSTGPAVVVRQGTNSVQTTMRDCTWTGCNQAVVNYGDYCTVEDSWCSSSQAMNGVGVFETHGTLCLNRDVLVPGVNPENDQAWAIVYPSVYPDGSLHPGNGDLVARDVRFGGEGGGITPVICRAAYKASFPVVPYRIILDGCTAYALGGKRKCVVYLEQIPNQISVTRCGGLTNLPLIQVDPSLNLTTYLQAAILRGKQCLTIQLDKASVEVWPAAQAIPPQLQPFLVP